MLALTIGLVTYLVVGLILAALVARFVRQKTTWPLALAWFVGVTLLGPAAVALIVGAFILLCVVFYPACWANRGWQRFELWLAKMEWPAKIYHGLALTRCTSCGSVTVVGLTNQYGWCPTCIGQANDPLVD